MGVKVNSSVLQKVLKSRTVQDAAYKKLSARVENAKQILLQEFDEHPVTQEIQAGPDKPYSNTLPEGYGNLYSFLGFEEGREPTVEVRKQLEKIKVIKRPEITGRYWKFKAIIPTNDNIDKVSPMDWESGRSWIDAITYGLSGFSHYMFKLSRGRSGAGVQTKGTLGTGAFNGTSYLYGLLGKFRRKIGL